MIIKLKDFEPNKGYEFMEVLIEKGKTITFIPIPLSIKQGKKLFGNLYIQSYKYYNDTKSVSVLLTKRKVNCEQGG